MAGRAGSIAQVSSRTAVGSGNKRDSRFTPRIWRSEPEFIKSGQEPTFGETGLTFGETCSQSGAAGANYPFRGAGTVAPLPMPSTR